MVDKSLTSHRSGTIEPHRAANPLLSLSRQANRLLEDVFREVDSARDAFGGILMPNIDVTESESEIRIAAELPGIKEEDIEVMADDDVLTIRAEKRVERDDGNAARHFSERVYGTFQRSLRLPHNIDPEQVRAHFDHGVLTITLPRTARDNGRHRIAIHSGPPPAKAKASSHARH